MASFASSSSGKLSREEWRKQKDLDAARKAGTAPAEIGEDGEVINPHVPDYMSKAPWYLDTGKRSLKHQKKPDTGEKFVGIDDWYARGQKEGPTATKYRKGACANCGAMTHKSKDCLERPRKKGAKWTNKDIAADEHVSDFGDKKVDFAAKRDRWNGYDPAEHKRVMEQYEAVEEERRRLREEEIDKQTSTAAETSKQKKPKKSKGPTEDGDFSSSDEDEEAEDDKYAEAANMAGQKVDTDNRMSIRNLRIREDRAKYLYNLDPESAYYDPKTRSMREAPNGSGRPEDAQFAGDNFNRNKGDSVAMQRLQLFAWQAESRGNDLHLQANPTVNEKQFREFQDKKEKLRQTTKGSILDKYGGAEHFDSVPKELLSGQSENYIEYSRSGQVIKGQERAKAKSRFEEDVYDQNHVAIWGSWYDLSTGSWGYKCCHSTIPNSYCTGEAGIAASTTTAKPTQPAASAAQVNNDSQPAKADGREVPQDKAAGTKRRPRSASISSYSSYSGSESDYSSDASTSSGHSSSRRARKERRSSRGGDGHKRRRRSSRRSRSASADAEARHRGHRKSRREDESRGYSSRKHLGEGDVDSRLDRDKLKRALANEDRRRGRHAEDSNPPTKAAKDAAKPDWLKEAEEINSRGPGRRGRYGGGEEGDTEVTEEQMEAYRLKQQNNYEDPMANYRDEGDHE
ncbi:unnamed protein product [Jaminaea pallidilutea]